jgi:rpsG_bact: ribosomal protein S7
MVRRVSLRKLYTEHSPE